MDSFSIIISKDRASGYYTPVEIFCIVSNAVFMLNMLMNNGPGIIRNLCVFGISVCAVLVFSRLLKKYGIKSFHFSSPVAFILLGIVLFMLGNHYLGVCDIALAITAIYVSKPAKIVFTKEGITRSTLFRSSHQWNELSNVMLKDNVLTLDFRDNKLFQAVIDPALNPGISEKEFNIFCLSMLSAEDSSF